MGFVLLACSLLLLACSTSESSKTTDTTADTPAQAAALVNEAKAELQILMASDTSSFAQMADVFKKFGSARTLDPANQEAAFYTAMGGLILFADSSTTTALLNKMGLGSVRFEDARATPFESSSSDPVIIGGDPSIETYVDVTVAETLQYVGTGVTGSIAQAASLLNGLSSSFTSTLSIPDNGTTVAREFDNTDVQAVLAMLAISQAALTLSTIWDTSDVDALITSDSERDPTTGEPFLDSFGDPIDPLTNAELQAEIIGNTSALSVNTTAVANVKSLFSTAFTRLSDAMTSLLGESDTQSNDVITTAPDYLAYGQQEDVERFNMQLFKGTAAQLGTSFGAPGKTTVTAYDLVGKVTSFDQSCTPGGSDPNPNVEPSVNIFPTGIPVASLTSVADLGTLVVTGNNQQPANASAGLDGGYWFSFTFSAPVNFSVYTQESLSGTQRLSATMYFEDTSNNLTQWDADFDSAGGKGNILMSVDADYFDDFYIPSTVPTFYVKLTGSAASTATLHVDSSALDAVSFPVFLKGGGPRTFTTALYKRTVSADMAQMVDLMGGFWDTIDRFNLVLDDEGTPTDESVVPIGFTSLQSEVTAMLDGSTLSVTDVGGSPVTSGGTVNLSQDDIEVQVSTLENPTLATTGDPAIPTALGSICAQPYEFGSYEDVLGGFYQIE